MQALLDPWCNYTEPSMDAPGDSQWAVNALICDTSMKVF